MAAMALNAGLSSAQVVYTYDEQGRLISSKMPNGNTTSYTYDAVDNRTRLVMSTGNQAPLAAGDSVEVFPVATTAVYVLQNDSDPNNDALTVTAISTPTKGWTYMPSPGVILYTSITGLTGLDSFTYTVSDGTTTATATVQVTILAAGSPPTAGNVSFTVAANSVSNTVPISLGGGTAAAVYVDDNAYNGSAFTSGMNILYTPKAGFQGYDQFYYSASNARGRSGPAPVQVLVGTAPAAPTAGSATIAVPRNTPTTFALAITGNFTRTNILTQPNVGVGGVTINGKTATFTPLPGTSGSTSFTYEAQGPGGNSAPATITLNIASASGTAPTASNASITTTKNTPATQSLSVTGTVSKLFINGSGPDHGSVTVSGNSVTYTPATDYVGGDLFYYQALGPGGESSSALVNIAVNAPTLAAPSAANSSVYVDRNSSNNLMYLNLGGGPATGVTIVTNPATGTLSVTGAQIRYTPNANQNAADSFVYNATNSAGTSANATVGVTVHPATVSAPAIATSYANVAYNSSNNILPQATYVAAATGVQIVREPSKGTRTVEGTTIRYTPTPGYYGSDSLDYTASNAGGTSSRATINITVGPPAPSAHADGMSVPYNTAYTKALPVSGPYTSLQAVQSPAHGAVAFSGGSVTFTPTTSYSGSDYFTYRAIGPGGTGNTERVDVVVGVSTTNQPPIASANSVQTLAAEVAIDVIANDTDPDADPLTILSLSSYDTGRAKYRISGRNIYVTPGTMNATDQVTYTVSDGRGGVAQATLTTYLRPN